MQRQCAALGVDPQQLVTVSTEPKVSDLIDPRSDDCEVWPEHHDAVRVFCAAQSQWRMAVGMGGAVYLGLDYPGVKVLAEAMGVRQKRWGLCLMQLQVMEFEGRKLLNEANKPD